MEGKHLLVDCFECDRTVIDNADNLYNVFYEIVKRIKMKILVPPIIQRQFEGLPGLSGLCMICTSHIAIHCFPEEKNKVNVDIYSCRDFDENVVLGYLEHTLKFKDCNSNVLGRE